MSKNTKFEWLATESAPKHYPMKIIQGTFIYHGEVEQGLYVPSGGTLKAGWGKPISAHVVGDKLKPLPDRLKIIFFSNAENLFYKGEFDLPYEKILTLFREAFASEEDKHILKRIMVGVAPGGAVAVWLTGLKGVTTKEVFFGQAEKIELDHSSAFGLPFDNQQESEAYIAKQLVNALTPEELESLKKNGIPLGLWARYRNRYDWRLTLNVGHKPDTADVIFLNGESIRDWIPIDKKEPDIPRAIPKRLVFYADANGEEELYTIDFDEFEIMEAFEKLAANGQKVYLELEPRIPRANIKVRLYNDNGDDKDNESIELKKFVSKK